MSIIGTEVRRTTQAVDQGYRLNSEQQATHGMLCPEHTRECQDVDCTAERVELCSWLSPARYAAQSVCDGPIIQSVADAASTSAEDWAYYKARH